MFLNATLSQKELVKLLSGETIEINKYMNGGEIQDQCILKVEKDDEFYERLINLGVLKIFETQGVEKLEEIFKTYLKKIGK